MTDDRAWVAVTRTIGHCARIEGDSTTYFDESRIGRYKAPRFASLMRRTMEDDSIVCLSVEYDIQHYLVNVDDLDRISIEKR